MEIKNLTVEVAGREVLKSIDLSVMSGSTSVLFGPNGSGKSTLLSTIMGIGDYHVVDGEILLDGEDITSLPIHERAKRGIGLMSQRPPNLVGVQLKTMLKVTSHGKEDPNTLASKLGMERFLERDVNVGFSGGRESRDRSSCNWRPRTLACTFLMNLNRVWTSNLSRRSGT